jgi:hypothetical protein
LVQAATARPEGDKGRDPSGGAPVDFGGKSRDRRKGERLVPARAAFVDRPSINRVARSRNRPEDAIRIVQKKDPLVLVHYMPWFQTPPFDKGYGSHWHMGGGVFDPHVERPDGKVPIASHYYPLTSPYDSRDPLLLEYQVGLMKAAGIDGAIFTLAMIEAKKVAREDSLKAGKAVMAWMQANWFKDEAYVKFDGQPLLLCFGPQFYKDPRLWPQLFEGLEPGPGSSAWMRTTRPAPTAPTTGLRCGPPAAASSVSRGS